MKRNILLSSIALLTFISVFTVQSQAVEDVETTSSSEETSTVTPTKKTREEIMEQKEAKREELKTQREELREATKQQREEIKAEMESKREEFQTKMEEMKDARKQALVERFDEKIGNFNEKHSEKLNTHVTRMEGVLAKIQLKSDAAKAKGTDVKEVEAAITSAETAIESAKSAISAQMEMDYVIDFEDESNLRTVANEVYTQFKTDIKEVHELVRAAHAAVVKAARALAQVDKGTSTEPKASSSEADSMMEGTEEN